MVSLVGANLITAALQPIAVTDSIIAEPLVQTKKLDPTKVCAQQFGCNNNLCWKACGNETNSWCFTTPKTYSNKLKACEAAYECSPCWSCVGVCHIPNA